MLFNSLSFLFLFLPITWVGFVWLLRLNVNSLYAFIWLVAASLFFYASWNPVYILLIVASILSNYWFGRVIARSVESGHRSKLWLLCGVAMNVAVLGYYKYTDFTLEVANGWLGTTIPQQNILLPLAISFFTFQQIAFLVDCYRGQAREESLLNYSLFISFFPKLIAGPIVRYQEMMPQIKAFARRIPAGLIASGLALFAIGFFKKAVLADSIAVTANTIFNVAGTGKLLSFADAWGGALAYTFEIYFDFSGYSDMAIGLAMLFGIRLPVNFLSPYRATGFIDFWKRWHITLSRFLRDYLYIPLGGNRNGRFRQGCNIIITMLLGGLWHGASWTFVLWGGLHGIFIAFNHGFRTLLGGRKIPSTLSIPITFLLVTSLWVLLELKTSP